jgi:hypothetical protein
MSDVDYSELDPGIRETVRWLRGLGYETTDSGDGQHKRPSDCYCPDGVPPPSFQPCDCCQAADVYECWLPYPNVAIVVEPPDDGVQWARVLGVQLVKRGVSVTDPFGPSIQFTYNPADDTGIIMLTGVDDALLSEGGE